MNTSQTPRFDGLRLDAIGIGDLRSVTLTVAAGEIHCLSGPSGCGKSRLLRAVADLEPHVGEAWLHGVAQASLPGHAWRARVMLVPAESQWWADDVAAHLRQRPNDDDLAALGFSSDVLGWQVSRLSSGEKQRLALLRAVGCEPAALLLDEPTANLDATTTRQVEAWLTTRIRRGGWPTLWVAHDAGQIERVADRHWRLHGSALQAEELRSWT